MTDPAPRQVDPAAGSAAAGAEPAGSLRAAVRAGGRYSRFVSTMRVALPLVAGMIVALVVAWPEIEENRQGFELGISQLSVHDKGGQQIVNPRFTGTDRNRRPYSVTADSAAQAKEASGQIDLAFPKADLTARNGTWIAVSAASGRYDRQAETLLLKGGVDMFHDQGYELHTPSARVDLAQGRASGDQPVRGQGPFGTLQGTGFRVWDSGRRLLIAGKSRIVLHPTGGRSAP